MEYSISLFNNKHDVDPKVKIITWGRLIQSVQRPAIRATKDGWLMCAATFGPDPETGRPHRRKGLATVSSMICGDVDHGAAFIQIGCALSDLQIKSLIYTTYSHKIKTDKNPNAEDRMRIVIPLASPIPAERYELLWAWLQQSLEKMLDPACKDISRMYYTPAVSRADAPYQWRDLPGDILDWRDLDLARFEQKNRPLPPPLDEADGWEDLKRQLIDRIASHETAHRNHSGKIDCRGICHDGKGKTALFADPSANRITCTVGCDLKAILRAFGLPERPKENAFRRLARGASSRRVVIPAIKG